MKILTIPDDTLRQVSRPVKPGDAWRQLADAMLDTLYASGGLGLSAVQVGVPWQLFVTRDGKVYVNPTIKQTAGLYVAVEEGCLSCPGVRKMVPRWEAVVLAWQEEPGRRSRSQIMSGGHL